VDRRSVPHGPACQETVLLVEDEDQVRRLTRRILESNGYRVVEASSAANALRMIGAGSPRPDVLVTDVVMPGMNGFELARQLQDGQPELPVLYMTGYSYDELHQRGLAQQEVRVLDKPFAPATLLRNVRETLDGLS
jgi:CheY-like chemotaxis protein